MGLSRLRHRPGRRGGARAPPTPGWRLAHARLPRRHARLPRAWRSFAGSTLAHDRLWFGPDDGDDAARRDGAPPSTSSGTPQGDPEASARFIGGWAGPIRSRRQPASSPGRARALRKTRCSRGWLRAERSAHRTAAPENANGPCGAAASRSRDRLSASSTRSPGSAPSAPDRARRRAWGCARTAPSGPWSRR